MDIFPRACQDIITDLRFKLHLNLILLFYTVLGGSPYIIRDVMYKL